MHLIPTLQRSLYCLAAVFAESLKARYKLENEDVVGAAPTGDAPTTSEWSTILLPTKVPLILEVLQYLYTPKNCNPHQIFSGKKKFSWAPLESVLVVFLYILQYKFIKFSPVWLAFLLDWDNKHSKHKK